MDSGGGIIGEGAGARTAAFKYSHLEPHRATPSNSDPLRATESHPEPPRNTSHSEQSRATRHAEPPRTIPSHTETRAAASHPVAGSTWAQTEQIASPWSPAGSFTVRRTPRCGVVHRANANPHPSALKPFEPHTAGDSGVRRRGEAGGEGSDRAGRAGQVGERRCLQPKGFNLKTLMH